MAGLVLGPLHQRSARHVRRPCSQKLLVLARQYGKTAVVPPNWPTWTMWQYTDGGLGPEPHTVDGIGRCDRDKFQGTIVSLRKL